MPLPFGDLLAARDGHFRYESGLHGSLWLDLDQLFLHPRAVQPLAADLAARLAATPLAGIVGPLVGGALLAQMIAAALDVEFFYAERFVPPEAQGLYPVEYRLPPGVRGRVRGRAVAVVDDVISAGSAVRGTLADLRAGGADVAAVGALLVLGEAAPAYFAAQQIPLLRLADHASPLWCPDDCPLCRAGVPLEDPTAPG